MLMLMLMITTLRLTASSCVAWLRLSPAHALHERAVASGALNP
jgi:hypothetical protein